MNLLKMMVYSSIWFCLKDPIIISVLCRSLVDAVYALKDEVHELKKVSVLIFSMDFINTSQEVITHLKCSTFIFLILLGNRRANGWSSSWRTSRSHVRSWRGLSGSWPSRRTTALLGMTVEAAATDLIRVTTFVRLSSVQGCKEGVWCLVWFPCLCPTLRLRTRLLDFPPWHSERNCSLSSSQSSLPDIRW